MSLQIITQHNADGADKEISARALANDVDVQTLDLEGLERIDLNFPKFTDGRAFSQAFVLRHDQDAAHGENLLTHYKAFYQGDAVTADPKFARVA